MSFSEFWFLPENRKKWFANDPTFDAEILDKFGHLIIEIDDRYPLPNDYTISSYLETILICDQLTRHYDRVNNTNIRHNATKYAVKMSILIIDEYYNDFLHVAPAKQCFILLPLRHTRDLYLVKRSIQEVYVLMKRYIPPDETTYYQYCKNRYQGLINYMSYLSGNYPDYHYDINRIGKKIPNIYQNFYKASLECLADISTPTHYPPTDIEFPERPKLLDEKCQFDIKYPIGFNKTTNQMMTIPDTWKTYFEETLPEDKTQKIIISISGGGDSMTCCYLLKTMGYDVTAVMIDYNNRDTCSDEVQMVHWWCSQLNIHLYVLHIDDIKRIRVACIRDIYETVTRRMRFNAYKKTSEMIGAKVPRVILGHNKDDSFENIISNLTKCRSMDNLKAIKPFHCENDVWIYRPLRNIAKCDITCYLDDINGPYLYDSTPKWSFRGRTRDILIPQLNDFNKDLIGGLDAMADKMYDMSQRYYKLLETNTKFHKEVIEIYLSKRKPKVKVECIIVSLMSNNYDDENYWLYIFKHLMETYNCPMIGNKTIKLIINNINKGPVGNADYIKVNLVKTMECRIYLNQNRMIVYNR